MSKEIKKTKEQLEEEREKAFQEKLKELKKRDPFVYKNFQQLYIRNFILILFKDNSVVEPL